MVSDKTGLYLLNIDPEGEPHPTSQGTRSFQYSLPWPMRTGSGEFWNCLYASEFWTPFGIRTVGRKQQEYDPDHGVQLLGGIWPNLTAWVAYSSKSYSPRRMVSAMRNIWKISEVENPKAYHNVMPGLFPERLSGETFKSRGMAMSPWVPPTYLWLAYEGPLGFEPSPDGLHVNPHLPADWKWIGVRDIPIMGTTMSCFYYRRTLYSSIPCASRGHCVVLKEDVSRNIECDAPFAVALANDRETLVFVGTDRDGQFSLRLLPPIVSEPSTQTLTLAAGDAAS